MKKLYQKNEVLFAIILIVIYVVGTSVAEELSTGLGINKIISAVFHLIFATVVLVWIVKNGYAEKYGLSFPKYNLSKVWFFVPLLVVACSGLAFGFKCQYNLLESVLYVISMICVGFLEEIIFRGFLFVGMAKTNIKSAIIVSSITFGIGHIVNLLNGQDIVETLVQIVFAVAVGFVLVILFYRGKSLLPCIIFHAVNNSLSAFEKTNEEVVENLPLSVGQFEILFVSGLIVLMAVYAFVLVKKFNVSRE